jgi:hypothetical protein
MHTICSSVKNAEAAWPNRQNEGSCSAWFARWAVTFKVKVMAERVGFEPTLEFPLNTLSKRAPSATRPSLRALVGARRLRLCAAQLRFYWPCVMTATGRVPVSDLRGMGNHRIKEQYNSRQHQRAANHSKCHKRQRMNSHQREQQHQQPQTHQQRGHPDTLFDSASPQPCYWFRHLWRSLPEGRVF